MNIGNQKSKWKLWYTQLLLFVVGILLCTIDNSIGAFLAPGFFVAPFLLKKDEKDRKLLSDIKSFLEDSPSKYNGQRA